MPLQEDIKTLGMRQLFLQDLQINSFNLKGFLFFQEYMFKLIVCTRRRSDTNSSHEDRSVLLKTLKDNLNDRIILGWNRPGGHLVQPSVVLSSPSPTG